MNTPEKFTGKKDFTGKKINMLTVLGFARWDVRPYGRISMWNVRCQCGTVREMSSAAFRSGQQSCGCLLSKYRANHPGNARKLQEGQAAFNSVFSNYQYRAKRKNLEFLLTENEFRLICERNCFYCGVAPQQGSPQSIIDRGLINGDWLHNGIDRIDSSFGYTVVNCVPCCCICNKAKLNHTYRDFIEWIKRITNYASKIDFNYQPASKD